MLANHDKWLSTRVRTSFTKTGLRKFSNQRGKPTLSHLKTPPFFRFGPFEFAKEPQLGTERATVATQLWPFRLLTVALLQARRARMEKSAGFFCGSNPVFRSGWRILADVFLSILFGTVRPLAELPFTCFCWCAPQTYYSFSPV